MELPKALRANVDQMLESAPLEALRAASAALSTRYRAEVRDGRRHLDGENAVKAYLAARLPATYAAVRAAMGSVAEAWPEYNPTTLLDIGSGPGTAAWAASDCWTSLRSATLLENSRPAIEAGQTLGRALDSIIKIRWLEHDIRGGFSDAERADLVTLTYVLDELQPREALPLIERLWAVTGSVFVIVEPGTPAGHRRILEARSILVELGGFVAAPCPHDLPCPLKLPDWCHFSQRVARSRVHRLTKGADVPWEDEKYAFVAVSRNPPLRRGARVLAPPVSASGRVTLKLCDPDGQARLATFSRRQGVVFKAARRAKWGDTLSKDD